MMSVCEEASVIAMRSRGRSMDFVACSKCGAGLLPPDERGYATCHACGTIRAESSDALASSPAADGARIVMSDDTVLAFLRDHFAGIASTYLCPTIPGKRELAARAVHA